MRFLRLNDGKRADIRLFKRTIQSIVVEPWARPPVLLPVLLTGKPQSLLLLHSTGAVASTVKNNKTRSFSSVTVSLIAEVTIDYQQSTPRSAALRRSGTPCALVKTTLQKGESRKAYRTVERNTKPLASRPLASSTSSRKEKHNNQKEKVI